MVLAEEDGFHLVESSTMERVYRLAVTEKTIDRCMSTMKPTGQPSVGDGLGDLGNIIFSIFHKTEYWACQVWEGELSREEDAAYLKSNNHLSWLNNRLSWSSISMWQPWRKEITLVVKGSKPTREQISSLLFDIHLVTRLQAKKLLSAL